MSSKTLVAEAGVTVAKLSTCRQISSQLWQRIYHIIEFRVHQRWLYAANLMLVDAHFPCAQPFRNQVGDKWIVVLLNPAWILK